MRRPQACGALRAGGARRAGRPPREGGRRARRGGGTRSGAGAAALVLAGLLALAGCGSAGSDASSKAANPAVASGGGAADANGGAGGGSQDSAAGDASRPTGAAPGASGRAAGPAGAPPAAPAYLVRTADLTVQTPHVRQQLDRAREYAVEAGGYPGDEDTTVDARGHAASTVQLRVPPSAYDRLLTELGGLGTLLDRKVAVKDVTGQVVDVQSRIRSQQASVARVRKLMDQAGSLTDVVTLESELSTRESDLEALEAQQASLKSQTGLATVTLRLTEPPVKAAPPEKPVRKKGDGLGTTVGHAAGDGWHAFYVTVRALLVVIVVVLPFAVVLVLGWFVFRRVRGRLPRRSVSAPPSPWGPVPEQARPVPAVPADAPSAPKSGTGPETAPRSEPEPEPAPEPAPAPDRD
ncbi:DUF4349 domain-containing protein [Streptomyces sp. V4-01]|uniref:DUF4349 domain-containing protein n=1 Tax=Actinacidiphila polyblastidii TaxID=3110430 RepID=A0ABU7P9P1_9ACTN|nr:DUF4349 domain-containing protein [Streptomyces sp. V4-01]